MHIRSALRILALLCLLLPGVSCAGKKDAVADRPSQAMPSGEINGTSLVKRDANALRVKLAGGTALTFALRGNRFLGLQTARVGDLDLTHDQTLLRPIIADDAWEQDRPWVVHRMTLRDVSVRDGVVSLKLALHASRAEQALKGVYLWAGDTGKALGPAITPELRKAQRLAGEARELLDAAAENLAQVKQARGDIRKAEQQLAERKKAGRRGLGPLQNRIRRLKAKLPSLRESLYPRLAKADTDLQTALRQIETFHDLRNQRALEVGRIHRDYFGSAMFRLPSEVNRPGPVGTLARAGGDDTFPAGELTWTFTPVKINVAGWPYRGWKHQYHLKLAKGLSTRFFRESGTWELAGRAVGTTVVALRYRGLGGVDETFQPAEDGGGIDRNFTTTEIIPGAAGGAPVISPVVPAGSGRNDRGFGLAHRVSPWIGRMVRGAGSPMFEFQHRPEGLFASFPDRLADLRAVTEAFHGDHAVSQINEEAFPRSSRLETTPQYYLALPAPPDKPFAVHECQTRWQEMDQYTRRRVSKELGFVQAEPLPGVGLNLDTAWEPRIRKLTERMDRLAEMGVRMILVHQPGWMNGRGLKECKDPNFSRLAVGGGDCSIYDYRPRPTVADEWKKLTRKLAEHEVAYICWSSYFSVGPGQFIRELREDAGLDKSDFAGFENLDAMVSDPNFFERLNVPHNPNNNVLLERYVARIDRARRTLGLHGIWADSWHKWALVVSNDRRRQPSFRTWMEQMARWSRQGMAFVSEGQGCPVMSCSIELSRQEFVDEWWFLPHTTLWYRGKATPPGAGTVKADRHAFRLMANKCWPFIETGWGQDVEKILPGFSRLAGEYNLALPRMRRSYVLPDSGGVLWLATGGNGRGVWFPFVNANVPSGVDARYIGDDSQTTATVKAYRTYLVSADDLLKAFSLRAAPQDDPRIEWKYQPMEYTWPQWAKAPANDAD